LWRENHPNNSNGLVNVNGKPVSSPSKYDQHLNDFASGRPCVLRRERFRFDNIIAGPGASSRLELYVRDRVHESLVANRGVTFLCLSCGEYSNQQPKSTGGLDPPSAIIFGEKGGCGLASVAVSEMLAVSSDGNEASRRYTSGTSSRVSGSDGDCDAHGRGRLDVTLSIVVLSSGTKRDQESVEDLLATGAGGRNTVNHGGSSGKCAVVRRADGRYSLSNVTRVKLNTTSDFERILGVVLGRLYSRRSSPQYHPQSRTNTSGEAYDFSRWETERTEGGVELPLGESESSLLITATLSKIQIGSQAPIAINFVCPFGDLWYTPGLKRLKF